MRARWFGLLAAGLLVAAGAAPAQAQGSYGQYGSVYGSCGTYGGSNSGWAAEHDRLHQQLQRAEQLWLQTHAQERYRNPQQYARDYAALQRQLEQAHQRWHDKNGGQANCGNGGYGQRNGSYYPGNGGYGQRNGSYYPGNGGYYPSSRGSYGRNDGDRDDRHDNGRHRGWYKGTAAGPPGQYSRSRSRNGQQRARNDRDDRRDERTQQRDDRNSNRGRSDDSKDHKHGHGHGHGHDDQGE